MDQLDPVSPGGSTAGALSRDTRSLITDDDDGRQESAPRIVGEVLLPFLLAGLGSVFAGLILDLVQVRTYTPRISVSSNICSASYQNKTFCIFNSVFSVKLSIDWINIVVLRFFLVYFVVDFIVYNFVMRISLHNFVLCNSAVFLYSAIEAINLT